MSGYFGVVAEFFYLENPMQNPTPCRPEFYLVKEQEKLRVFSVISLFFVAHAHFPIGHGVSPIPHHCSGNGFLESESGFESGLEFVFLAGSPGVSPGCIDLGSM